MQSKSNHWKSEWWSHHKWRFSPIVSGTTGILGNLFTLIVLCSSSTIRNKTVNMFLISQSLLDFLCAVVLIATAWDGVWTLEKTYFGISGKRPKLHNSCLLGTESSFQIRSIGRILQYSRFECDINYKILFFKKEIISSGGSRIFLRWGHQLPSWCYFANFLPKTARKWKKLDPIGGGEGYLAT